MLKCNKVVRQNKTIVKKELDSVKQSFDDVMETKLQKIIIKLKELKTITNEQILDEYIYDIEEDIKELRMGFAVSRQIRFNGYVFDYRINPIKLKAHIHKSNPKGYSTTRSYY